LSGRAVSPKKTLSSSVSSIVPSRSCVSPHLVSDVYALRDTLVFQRP